MMDSIKDVLGKVKSGWTNMDKKKRIAMISLISGIIFIGAFLTYSNNKVNYATLFNNLELDDAGTIVNDLEAQKIKYKLEGNGRNILIDERLVDEYRIQLAMNGMMPESSTGFEIFDDTGLMVTDQDRQVMYQRALTGELQRSIMSLEAVNNAKVHLVMPEKSIFDTEDKAASASVIIDLKPMVKVTPEMIRGIAALISGAVDNMPTENIQVIDSEGNLLSGFLDEDSSQTTMDIMSQHQSIRSKFEDDIESNLYKLLGNVLGRDKVNISVLADLDFDAEESTVIEYSNPVVRSEEIVANGASENLVTGGSIDDNISAVIDAGGEDDFTYSRITNNELSSETRSTIKAPGKINRLTTSVVYNGNLSDENLLKIQNIVASATGYDGERGDLISVESITFDPIEGPGQAGLDEFEEEQGIVDNIRDHIPLILRVLGVIALIGLSILTIRNILKKRKEDKLFQEQLAMASVVEEIEEDDDEEEDLESEMRKFQEKLEIKNDSKGVMAKQYAKENPELAADLIRAWLKD